MLEFGSDRAVMTARTEVNANGQRKPMDKNTRPDHRISASNLGSRAGALSTGLMLEHFWISTKDKNTRPDHRNANGQRKPMDQPYLVGNERLMFPGDTSMSATAKNTIVCRCTEGYRKKP